MSLTVPMNTNSTIPAIFLLFPSISSHFQSALRSVIFVAISALLLSQAEAQSPEIFNASGTFTVPTGVLSVTVEAWGAGGGGGGGSNAAAGGGGGGAYTVKTFGVTAAQVYTVTVGGGGSAGTDAAAGTAGTDSTINLQTGPGPILVKAAGGANGTASGGLGGLVSDCIPATAGIARSGGSGATQWWLSESGHHRQPEE